MILWKQALGNIINLRSFWEGMSRKIPEWQDYPGSSTVKTRSKILNEKKNCSKISEWQNCPGTPTVKTRSKIQNEKTALKSKSSKTHLKIQNEKKLL